MPGRDFGDIRQRSQAHEGCRRTGHRSRRDKKGFLRRIEGYNTIDIFFADITNRYYMDKENVQGGIHMKINGVSSLVLNAGNYPGKAADFLQKQKQQIQTQIKQIKESNCSAELKNEKIKVLQEQLQEIEKQQLEEQAKNLTDSIEAKKMEQETVTEDDDNAQVINESVTAGIVSASNHLENSKAAYSVYRAAKAKGDTNKMEQASSYAAPELQKASQSTKLAERGIKEYRDHVNNVDDTSENTVRENGTADNGGGIADNDTGAPAENSNKRIDLRA